MPQINRIRVNNVKYNFGTQYYDDFMMRFSGKNTLYDLANGGGKSLLMLLVTTYIPVRIFPTFYLLVFNLTPLISNDTRSSQPW